MHYYQFNIGDYHTHTSHLEPIEDLAYRRMIDWCYLHESPLPDSVEEIAKKIRMRDECKCIASVLQEFFTLTKDGYINERIVSELKSYQDVSKKRKKAANKRWANKHKGLSSDANALQVQSKSNAKQEPRTKNQEPLNNKHISAKADEVEQVFNHWVRVMGKTGQAKLTTKRKSCIEARLKEGYSTDDIKLAINGCAGSSYHMGQNDNGTIYDDLTLICRSGDKLENFINNVSKVAPYEKTGGYSQPKPSAADRVKQAIAREASQQGSGSYQPALDSASGNIRPQLCDSVRGDAKPELEGFIEGSYTRTD